MKLKKTTPKIYYLLGILFFIVMGIVLFIVQSNTNAIVSRLTSAQAQTANRAFVNYLSELEHTASERAEIIAGSEFVVDCLKNRDYETLGKILADFGEGIDSAAVCNADGIVIVRRHSDKAGDDVSWYTPVAKTMQTGLSSSALGSTKSYELATFATAAVYDGDTMIGIVACIFDLSKSKHLDTFKLGNGCEATIIYDGKRINTTIHDINGNRITGTKADTRIVETVLGNQTDYSGRLEIFDIMYQIYCSPLIVNGESVGMLFTGVDIDSALSDQREMNYIIILIAIIAFVAAGAVFIASHKFSRMHENVLEELSDKSAALHILETILNAMDIFIHVTALETDRILFANDRFKEHFSLSGNIIGETCWRIFSEGRCELCPKERLIANPGESITWEEYKNVTGRYYLTTARIIDWPDENKVVFHYRVDISNEKKIEIEKLEALEKAEHANRAKSDFLSRMSHEMRTPMNAIIGIASLAQRTVEPEELKGYIERINLSATHLLGIINDILDMSKIEAGAIELANDEIQFQDILNQIDAVMNVKFNEKCQEFIVKIDDSAPKIIIADRQKLTQVITNLLSNANKFTPEGGNISLNVCKTEDLDNGCKLQVVVEDDGIGIPEEQQERLFNAFEQVDNTITRQFGGTGLGLAISQKFVNMMGGEIWVKTLLGKGSAFGFTITVGVVREHNAAVLDTGLTAPEDIENIFSGKRILLADDVEINREILIALLEETGAAIDCAENGKEACAMFAAAPLMYDLIFMDIHMPEMNGYEATKAIREMEIAKARTIPIIAVTADVFSKDVDACLVAGMNDHVGKPLEIDVVIAKLKQYLL